MSIVELFVFVLRTFVQTCGERRRTIRNSQKMILKLFKNQRPITLGLLVLIALLLWSFAFLNMGATPAGPNHSIYQWIIQLIVGVPFLQPLIAVVLIIIQAVMINNIIIESQLISTRTYVPSFVYLVLMSSTPELLTFHPGLIGNFFLILMLSRLIATHRTEQSYSKIFDAGLYLGLASTVYFPYLLMLAFGWVALSILRSFAWRDLMIYPTGAIVPYLFILTYYYAFDNLTNLTPHFALFAENRMYQNIEIPLHYFPLLICFCGLVILGAKTVYLAWRIGVVKVKKIVSTLSTFSIFSLLLPIFLSGLAISSYTALAIPLCIYLSNYFINNHKPIIAEVSFLLLLTSIVYLQIVTL